MSEESIHLFEEFQQANRLIRRKVYEASSQIEGESLSPGQHRLMRVLGEQPGCSQKQLAEALRIRPGSLSELLKKLEQKGQLRREQNQQDRRIMNFYLTESGQDLLDQSKRLRQNNGEQIFDHLTSADQQELSRILRELMVTLRE